MLEFNSVVNPLYKIKAGFMSYVGFKFIITSVETIINAVVTKKNDIATAMGSINRLNYHNYIKFKCGGNLK